jgi:monoamine oxidase
MQAPAAESTADVAAQVLPALPDGGRVCVIGGGVSGLSAAWLLQTQANGKFHVTLLEKDTRLGGHAYTVEILPGVKVDLGFQVRHANFCLSALLIHAAGFGQAHCLPPLQVFNLTNYPHLSALFRHLDVGTIQSDMSLSVQLKTSAGAAADAGDCLKRECAANDDVLEWASHGACRVVAHIAPFSVFEEKSLFAYCAFVATCICDKTQQ